MQECTLRAGRPINPKPHVAAATVFGLCDKLSWLCYVTSRVKIPRVSYALEQRIFMYEKWFCTKTVVYISWCYSSKYKTKLFIRTWINSRQAGSFLNEPNQNAECWLEKIWLNPVVGFNISPRKFLHRRSRFENRQHQDNLSLFTMNSGCDCTFCGGARNINCWIIFWLVQRLPSCWLLRWSQIRSCRVITIRSIIVKVVLVLN
jgi:hypothetical protein